MKAGCLLARVRSAVLFGLVVGCTRDPSPAVEERSEFAMEFARRFCAVQTSCPCTQGSPFPDCELVIESIVGEREAAAKRNGLVYDEACAQEALETTDWFPTCEAYPGGELDGPRCPVYTSNLGVGEPCRGYSAMPQMSDCRAGLHCFGYCTDLDDPHLLALGEACGGPPIIPGHLNACGPGLTCDADTDTCVASPLATGDVCTEFFTCADGDYCRGPTPEYGPSADAPGVCTPATTPPNAACEYEYECDGTMCVDGTCNFGVPPLCLALIELTWTHWPD